MGSPEDLLAEERLVLGRRIVNLFGSEGSGKTTQAKLLAAKTDKPYIVVGDILRDLAVNDLTEIGDECRAMFAAHRYLDPKVLLRILRNRFMSNDLSEGFILDGGLRTLEEVQGFQSVLEQSGNVFPLSVIHLRIPIWLGVQRLSTNVHARKRHDDNINAVLKRQSHYYSNLGSRVSFIRRQRDWELLHVDARGSEEVIFQRVLDKLRGI